MGVMLTCLSTSSVIFLILALQSMLSRSSCLSMNSMRSCRSSRVSMQWILKHVTFIHFNPTFEKVLLRFCPSFTSILLYILRSISIHVDYIIIIHAKVMRPDTVVAMATAWRALPLLLCGHVHRVHDEPQGLGDLLCPHGVLLELGLHRRLGDALLCNAQTHTHAHNLSVNPVSY